MSEVLIRENIRTGFASEPYVDVIRRAGAVLVEGGYVLPGYVDGMVARDQDVSVAIGNSIAIPHGRNADKDHVLKTGLCVLTYPDGVDWNGTDVRLVVGIAAQGDDHMEMLTKIATAFMDEQLVLELAAAGDADRFLALLAD